MKYREAACFFFLFLRPSGKDLLDLARPLDLSAATVAELAIEEDFPFAIFAEEPFLLLQFLSHVDVVGPRLGGTC
jgi:hypothetical protein